MSMKIYEPKGVKKAWMIESKLDFNMAFETDIGQFVIMTDHPWRAATHGAILLAHLEHPISPDLEASQKDAVYGWEAWVFDRRICATIVVEMERMWETRKYRKFGEEVPLATDEEIESVYKRLHIPQYVNDAMSVFRNCIEIGDNGKPITGVAVPIDAFWRNGRFGAVARERIAEGDWFPD